MSVVKELVTKLQEVTRLKLNRLTTFATLSEPVLCLCFNPIVSYRCVYIYLHKLPTTLPASVTMQVWKELYFRHHNKPSL